DAVLVTDDYAVQNVASTLGVEVMPFAQEGIKETLTWEWYCPGCRNHVGDEKGRCPVCDTVLKRRPKR
ncbi:MAG: heavy metal-binding domain-containing protein, partial [Candidatus Thermoplasmatota archaeon]|nr:heavy metal-binding domain-containing protein [Candidatus Thermoplasmatota archaeon]